MNKTFIDYISISSEFEKKHLEELLPYFESYLSIEIEAKAKEVSYTDKSGKVSINTNVIAEINIKSKLLRYIRMKISEKK